MPENGNESADHAADGIPWFALYTKSRQERCVERALNRIGIGTYLPLLKRVRKWSDRKKIVEVPYFTGYVFVHCHEEERCAAWSIQGAVRFLGSNGCATPVDPAELDAIREALTRRVPFEPHPQLEPGQLVTVTTGPLKGITGTLLRKQKKYRLVLYVKTMGQGISAEVDASDVEPA